jgi:hypothetical protein
MYIFSTKNIHTHCSIIVQCSINFIPAAAPTVAYPRLRLHQQRHSGTAPPRHRHSGTAPPHRDTAAAPTAQRGTRSRPRSAAPAAARVPLLLKRLLSQQVYVRTSGSAPAAGGMGRRGGPRAAYCTSAHICRPTYVVVAVGCRRPRVRLSPSTPRLSSCQAGP